MNDFSKFLHILGNMHDCTVTIFEWRPMSKTVILGIEDLLFNFEGLPGYPGPLSGQIEFEDVDFVEFDIAGARSGLRIYEFNVLNEEDISCIVSVSFTPSGKISFNYGRALFPDISMHTTLL